MLHNRPYYGSSLNLTTMAEDAEYQTGPYPEAVAVAGSGTIAVGADEFSPAVYLFTPGDSTATATYPLSGSDVDGLAWSKNGKSLFAVLDGPYDEGAPTLTVVDVS